MTVRDPELGTSAESHRHADRRRLGANASDFVVTQPTAGPIGANGNRTFNVRFQPTANGLRTVTLTIANSDADENPYTITLQGTGTGINTNLLFSEDFNGPNFSNLITTQSGTFTQTNMEFKGTRTPGTNAIATINLGCCPQPA